MLFNRLKHCLLQDTDKKEYVIEENIYIQLIGQQNYKQYFYYCKEDPKVENINLKSIEDHIRLDLKNLRNIKQNC